MAKYLKARANQTLTKCEEKELKKKIIHHFKILPYKSKDEFVQRVNNIVHYRSNTQKEAQT
jgi:hypothetical protein